MPAAHRRKSEQRERDAITAARIEAGELKRAPIIGIPPADSIPGYIITREIGRGGMGVIYEAQQQEPPRAVALKVMRGGAVSKHRLRLFRQEMETLARLSCSNIAAIYGAGSTHDGRHFFAMELVRGVPVTEYVRLHDLTIRKVLLLFQHICQAVHYAHQRGVIHRDLKPSNIIIDMDGNPKILDFGLARMTDADEAMRAMFAEAGKIMGTLPYMSPEQAEGNLDAVDIRTDIYSLGVVLYELLTDRLPYELSQVDHDEARRVIRDQRPPRPSRFRRKVRGDLELIILKALEKDPARRYESALTLSGDIGRFLQRQPIVARPLTVGYLFRRFIMRQKLPFAFSVALIAMLAGFGIWVRIDAERQRVDEQQRLRAVDVWRQKIQAENRDRRVAAEFWSAAVADVAESGFLDQAAEQVDRELSDNPAAAAAIHETLGSAYARLGDAEKAARQWETAVTVLRRAAEQRMQRGDFAGTEMLLIQEYELRRRLRDPEARTAASLLVDMYQNWSKPEQAATWRSRRDAVNSGDGD